MTSLGRRLMLTAAGLVGAALSGLIQTGTAQAHCGCGHTGQTGYVHHAVAHRYVRRERERRVVVYRYVEAPVSEQHYGYIDEDQGQAYADQQPAPPPPPPVEHGYQDYGAQSYGYRYGTESLPPPDEGSGYYDRGRAYGYARSWESERDTTRYSYYSDINGRERGGAWERDTVCDQFCRTHTYVDGDVWPRPPYEDEEAAIESDEAPAPGLFIADGGVGPAFIPGGGGGGMAVIGGGFGFGSGSGSGMGAGSASASAMANASASASANISSSITIGGMISGGYGGMKGWGGGMSHGCGCGGGGGGRRW